MKYIKHAVILFFLAAPVFAQDSSGTITGTLEFDEARWGITSIDAGPETMFEQGETDTQILLVGTPDGSDEGGPGTLIIDIAAATGATEAVVTEVRMELMRENGRLFAENANIDLTLEAYELTGDALVVAGSFTATLTPTARDGLVATPGDGMPFSGEFQATIRGNTQPD